MNARARAESKCSLAAEVLHSWGMLRLRTRGISMLPTLWPGDLVTVESCSFEQVEPGEVVLYVREGRFLVSHRMVRKCAAGGRAFLITRGDCMTREDPPMPRGALLGKITAIRRAGSLLAPAQKLTPFHRIFAGLLCHWSFLQRVLLHLHARRADADSQFKVAAEEAAS